jgi:hypothetical protein
MSPDELFTRDEVLGGLPAKRAATLLFLIESRTAHLVDQSRRAMEIFLTEEAAKERDLAFLEAFSLGREAPVRPTIQDIERFAPQWATLVPDNPQVQAAVAYLLGQKYEFTHPAVPGIRAALGLDEEAIRQAYRRLYRQPLETLFATRAALGAQLRWAWARVAAWPETLSPFWTACVMTVGLSLPTAILALPIAVARVGPLIGMVFLVVIGLLNVLTMGCMAEACARSGAIRYGKAFVGRLVTDLLGDAGSFLLSLALAMRQFLALLASAFGLAITMLTFTQVPVEVWIALLFAIELYLLSRKTLKLSVTVMMLLGVINVALLLPIAFLGLHYLRPENLLAGSVPFLAGEHFDPLVLRLVFGVILSLYFGHVYVVHCARVVLPRDPSARSLIRGSMVGTAFLIVLLAIWVLAIGGAVAPQALAGQAGTALTPLAEKIGPSVEVLGSGLIIFFLGLSCIRTANVLFNLVHERLPTRPRSIVMLLLRRGSLVFHQRRTSHSGPRFGLTYLGLAEGQPHFRLDVQWDGNIHREEITVREHWDATMLLERLPELHSRHVSLTLETLETSPEGVRLRVSTPMSLTYEGNWGEAGLDMAEALTLPESLRQLVTWMMRQGDVSLAEVTAHIGQDEGTARSMLNTLVKQGFVQATEVEGGSSYRIRLALRRGRKIPEEIWQALDVIVAAPASSGAIARQTGTRVLAHRALGVMLSERGRFLLSVSPVVIALLLAWWLLLTGAGSFAWLLSFSGVITNTLAAGIFPVLLLISSRQKGDLVPGVVYRFLGRPVVLATICVLFLVNLFLHGLIIWQNPLARASAVLVGLLAIGVLIVMARHGAFAPRIIVELREDQREGGQGAFAITAGGQPAPADVRLVYPEREERHQTASGAVPMLSTLRYVIFHLPKTSARELKVWVHRVTPEGGSEGLSAVVEVHSGNETRQLNLRLSGGDAVVPLTADACWVRITLPEPSTS